MLGGDCDDFLARRFHGAVVGRETNLPEGAGGFVHGGQPVQFDIGDQIVGVAGGVEPPEPALLIGAGRGDVFVVFRDGDGVDPVAGLAAMVGDVHVQPGRGISLDPHDVHGTVWLRAGEEEISRVTVVKGVHPSANACVRGGAESVHQNRIDQNRAGGEIPVLPHLDVRIVGAGGDVVVAAAENRDFHFVSTIRRLIGRAGGFRIDRSAGARLVPQEISVQIEQTEVGGGTGEIGVLVLGDAAVGLGAGDDVFSIPRKRGGLGGDDAVADGGVDFSRRIGKTAPDVVESDWGGSICK